MSQPSAYSQQQLKDLDGTIKSMAKNMDKLAKRLAPDNPTFFQVPLKNVQPGTVAGGKPVTLNGKFNELMASIVSGVAWIYWNNVDPSLLANLVANAQVNNNPPDLVLGPSTQPQKIPFGVRDNPTLTIIAAPNQATPLVGQIYILWY